MSTIVYSDNDTFNPQVEAERLRAAIRVIDAYEQQILLMAERIAELEEMNSRQYTLLIAHDGGC